ncbi:hypothetical protein COO20_04895 [Thalassospira marina]|uniref:RNA polymerase sigma factor 70 region 4 type 2 domain-containing protein n=1 Tax=Thalassospira marina TaxID=2048283 RepID=A0A2N3KYD8_9PROT|nr:hypothetical protein COO20_04895 [Thalassospira marina]
MVGNIYRNKINFRQAGDAVALHYILPTRQLHTALTATNEGHPSVTPTYMEPPSFFAYWRSIARSKNTTHAEESVQQDHALHCNTCNTSTFHAHSHHAQSPLTTGLQSIEPAIPHPSSPGVGQEHAPENYRDTTIPELRANNWALPQNTHMSAGHFDANWQYQRPCTVDNSPWPNAISQSLLPHLPMESPQAKGQIQHVRETTTNPVPVARPADPTPDIETRFDPQTYAASMAPNFWPLWIAQRDSLLRQCLKLMSGNMDDAQDALSEAMVKASMKFEESMDEIRNHRAWLSRIVHNACIDLHRQNRRKAEYHEETHNTEDESQPSISRQDVATPEQKALTGEMFSNLERALSDLPEKLRRPLLMRCVQDQSYDEIAENLGLTNCAVRKRVQLARDHLKGCDIR